VVDGDVDTGSVMAGQSVGMVTREQSTREILDELVAQAAEALRAREHAGDGDAQPGGRSRAGV
jgi:enoyl-[acyl-carrier protein] reductase II